MTDQSGVSPDPEEVNEMTTFGELCCEVCGISGSVVAMHRANEKGVKGRWRCESCLDTPPDPEVLAVTDWVSLADRPMTPELEAWVRAQRSPDPKCATCGGTNVARFSTATVQPCPDCSGVSPDPKHHCGPTVAQINQARRRGEAIRPYRRCQDCEDRERELLKRFGRYIIQEPRRVP